ncbi:hypothetical protein O1611_g2600 [Lasiodiplodia mahajangana]|uniref:Uncharacterized protein n=1 Tax=Lasiodiplodia mahajangana TaxID=1108764 RepID=A0ACC2JU79_9PEZI|nr:hypothetical protein O1611_g2600 [Lasiodiplodia mahajangana]
MGLITESKTKYAVMLILVSMMLSSALRCGQFLSKNGVTLNGALNKVASLPLPSTDLTPRQPDEIPYNCDQSYTIELLSIDPLVIYINNFIRDEDIEHLLALGRDRSSTAMCSEDRLPSQAIAWEASSPTSKMTETADGSKFALADGDTGLLVKPRLVNAVVWNNLNPKWTKDERTAHSGLPVESGTKVGLNIWSRYFLDEIMVGGE